MNQEWFSAKELIGLAGLPSSTQGIHAMARRHHWIRRRRFGSQGRGVEYHVDSLPVKTISNLSLKERPADYLYLCRREYLVVWVESYKQLHEEERKRIIAFIVRHGLSEMINRLNI